MQIESLYAISGEDTGYRAKTLDLKKSGVKPESTTVPNGRHKFPLLDETFLRKSGSQAGAVEALQSHGRVPTEPVLCKRIFLRVFTSL